MSPSPGSPVFDPSRDAADEGGMSLASGASAAGHSGPVSSYDPSLAGGQGGMTSTAGASAPGGAPNASVGPDAWHRGYAQGQHDQSVLDHEHVHGEDPIGPVVEGIMTKGESLIHEGVHAAADWISEALSHSTGGPDGGDHSGPDSADNYDPYAGIPDATIQPDSGSGSDAGPGFDAGQ